MTIFSQNKNRWSTKVSVLMATSLAFVGCKKAEEGAGGDKPKETKTEATQPAASEKKVADLVYVNWAEGIAYTHLAKAVLEDKMGYEVKLTAADVGPAYTAVAQGNKDAFMETWLPTLHKDYIDKFKDKVVDLGHVYEGTQSGLVVPEYVTISKISELNSKKGKFDGKIIGIDAGAGIMKTTDKVIKDYGLDFKLVQSSGPAMTAALKKAVDNNEWIVVTGWKPHWKFGRWKLKFLEQDADKMVWKPGNIHIMGRKDLEKDKPTLAAFLRKMKLSDKDLSNLMIAIKESGDGPEKAARAWMKANEAVVSVWVPAS
jgi:glycine betaine/proline transport system substrate-binding protein